MYDFISFGKDYKKVKNFEKCNHDCVVRIRSPYVLIHSDMARDVERSAEEKGIALIIMFLLEDQLLLGEGISMDDLVDLVSNFWKINPSKVRDVVEWMASKQDLGLWEKK